MAIAHPSKDKNLRILLVDDSEDDALLILNLFRQGGYGLDYQRVDNAPAMREALNTATWDIVLSDHGMPNFNAVSALNLLHEFQLDIPFIIVSGAINEETAVAAMRAGAHDYLSKNKLDRLLPAVRRELRESRNRAERHVALEAVRDSEARFRVLTANLPGMVFQLLREADNNLRFLYVSEGCQPLLRLPPAKLLIAPGLFPDMIVEEDRSSFDQEIAQSAAAQSLIDWNGRVSTAGDRIKWVNVRSSPRRIGLDRVLWEGIISDITQSKQAELELLESRAQLAALSSHLEASKEEERERIARDIHDELGSTLVAIKFELALLARKTPLDPQQLNAKVHAIEALTDNAIGTAGRVARELRPGILKDFGLAAAIESHVLDFSQRTGIPCRVLNAEYDSEPPQATSIALFRICQEALTNVGKHAHATQVNIQLLQNNDKLILEITDNGCGIAAESLRKPAAFGLRGIRERINSLHGTMEIGAAPGGGTHILVCAPIPVASGNAAQIPLPI